MQTVRVDICGGAREGKPLAKIDATLLLLRPVRAAISM